MMSLPHNRNIMVFCGCVWHVMDVWALTMYDIIVNSHYYILKVCMAIEAFNLIHDPQSCMAENNIVSIFS